NTGCNYFNAEIYIHPPKTNSVEFGKMGLTRMACPKFEQEQSMMLGLEETTNAIQGDNGRVMLLKADGTPVIVLEKQTVK
ncbi:MAG: META domain-containing protein, partial [Muribaculaceae bacterium]|nr:META domain-containing protein [Muribaculaceae bacterium]